MTKDVFLKAGPKRETIELSSIGKVIAKGLTVAEAIEYQKRHSADPANSIYYLVIVGVLDENGKPIFSDTDIEALRNVDSQIIETIVSTVLRLGNMVPATAEKKLKPAKH